ncbi:hypothetical protein [Actinophytocola glycyrrhizae]|uniref:Uncharacterized protein n=1 Tax=Actinophytocola glycyrrhizae TaxID=2044873 RepID=A0ABV9RTQ6_9PSEU
MNSELLRGLTDVHGPFASVYLPPDAGGPGWLFLRRLLAAQDADPEVLAVLDEAMRRPAAAEGRALIANREGVLVDGPLSWSPPSPVARFSALPYLLPLVRKQAVHAPEAALVAAGPAGQDTVGPPPDRSRVLFDQFLFESSRPDGPVVQGLGHCAAALRDGNADAVVLVEGVLGGESVWVGGTHRDQVAQECAELRALGMPANRQRADEALPMAALKVDAELLVGPADLPLADGVGVLLRHP